ncbi:hypothetical protein [Streptomyces griseocarneus]|uniref:hypothetical protein n=1 Tax=Streptomyces griseocarneus TaxID=51201 RepID=UPI00167E959E|nr:hypothetical protein [Streptomyces griseocarneus]MBZ6476494.1 hypothetical protein [Streptomyces griseocarneus]
MATSTVGAAVAWCEYGFALGHVTNPRGFIGKTISAPLLFALRIPWRRSSYREAPLQAQHSRNLELTGLALATTVGVAVFCLLFATINPLLQLDSMDSDEIRRQWNSGILALRAASVIFVVFVLRNSVSYLRWLAELGSKKKLHESKIESPLDIPARLSEEDRQLRDLCQSAIFTAALFVMWVLYAQGVRTAWTAIIAWVFTFFSDDWVIMSDYSRVLKGQLLRWHRLRINVANALLVVILGIVAWQQWVWLGAFYYLANTTILVARYRIDR